MESGNNLIKYITFNNIINETKNIILDLNDTRLIDDINEFEEKIKLETIYIVVLGLFKRGKSSFINALLGKELLPAAITPLTSIITYIEYGEQLSIIVFFNNKTQKNIEVNELIDYIGESENRKNYKNVNFVKIKFNSQILKRATFIDTPGIGSVLEDNTNRTIGFIEKIDAALFLLSADVPITKAEVEFLEKLKTRVPKIIFLFNKIDLINPTQLEKIISYNKETIKNSFQNEEINIIPISCKLALEASFNNDDISYKKSNFDEIQNILSEIEEKERQEILSKSNNLRLQSLIKEAEAIINLHINSLLEPIEILENKLSLLKQSYEILNNPLDFDILMDGYINKLQEYVDTEVKEYKLRLIRLFREKIMSNFSDAIKKVKSLGVTQFEKELTYSTINELDEIRLKIETEVKQKFKDILVKYKEQSNSLLNELFNNINLGQDFTFESLLNIFDLNVYSDFYYKFDFDFIPIVIKQSYLVKIIPNFLIQGLIIKKIIENFEIKIEANSGNLCSDIKYKIQESYRKFKYDLKEKMIQTVKRIEKIIEDIIQEKTLNESEIQAKKEKYLEMKEKINLLKRQQI